MKIQPIINIKHSIPFKSNMDEDTHVFGFDDEISKSRRNFIREHYNQYLMPNYEIYEANGRLEKYKLKNLIENLIGRKTIHQATNSDSNASSYMSIFDLPMHNIKHIEGTNSYRGSSIIDNLNILPALKRNNIKRIVDLVGYDSLKEACRKNDIEYLEYKVDSNIWDNDAFKSKKNIIENENSIYQNIFGIGAEAPEDVIKKALLLWKDNKQKFIEKFIPFIKTMQKDNVYIGCEFGTYKTDNALLLNYFFNSKTKTNHNGITLFNKISLTEEIENLYYNLTPENKKLLEWDNNFDKQFIPKLNKLKKSLKIG